MKKTTIDDLARMVTKGFTDAKKDLLETEVRLRGEIKAVDSRLSTVEFLLSSNRIERLEDSMRQVKTILKIK
jgi:hypothetical protein